VTAGLRRAGFRDGWLGIDPARLQPTLFEDRAATNDAGVSRLARVIVAAVFPTAEGWPA
jgi:hypothetical protein